MRSLNLKIIEDYWCVLACRMKVTSIPFIVFCYRTFTKFSDTQPKRSIQKSDCIKMVTITELISYVVQYLKMFQLHFGEEALLLFELVFFKRSLLCLSDTSLTAGGPEEEAGEHLEWWLVQVSLAL